MELRDYQTETVEKWHASPLRRVIVTYPTGAGKTPVAVDIMMHALAEGGRVLAVAHSVELIEQLIARLVAAGCPRESIGDARTNTDAPIQVASIQSLARRPAPGPFHLIVVDEAHHAAAKSYRGVLDAHPEAYVLGLTATPARLDGKPLGDVFEDIIDGPPAEWLIERGWLARPRYFAPSREDARALVDGVASLGGDYNERALSARMNRKTLVGDIVKHWQERAAGLRTIVCAVTVKHAKSIARRFVVAGVKAVAISGETPKRERAEMLAAFRRGDITVVVHCELFGEGLDVPDVRCVVLARPTKSLTVFRQQCGRAMRPGTVVPIILDHAGCVWLHDLPTTPVEWSLSGCLAGDVGGPIIRRCSQCSCVLERTAEGACANCGASVSVGVRFAPEESEWERLVEIAASNGVSRGALWQRLRKGWPSAAAVQPRSLSTSQLLWNEWAAVAAAHGVSRSTFRGRIRVGESPAEAASKAPTGSLWREWMATAKRHGVNQTLFQNRVRLAKWEPSRAASTPRRKVRPDWAQWRDIAMSNGVGRDAYAGRREMGWSARRAAVTPKGAPRSVWGKKWRLLAEAHGVKRTTWEQRVKRRWTPERAATTPPSGAHKDIAGMRFGRLTALRTPRKTEHGERVWVCACDCGAEREVTSSALLRARSPSCGGCQTAEATNSRRKS